MGILESISETIAEWFMEGVDSLITGGYDLYAKMVKHAINLLSISPDQWNSAGWNKVTATNTVFVGVGGSLVVLFFLIGFCEESLDVKQDIRFENMIRMFIKLSIGQFFVTQSLPLVQTCFGLVPKLFKLDSTASIEKYSIPSQLRNIIKDPTGNDIGGFGAFVCLLLSVIFWLVLVVSAAMIIYQAYIRFFKILLVIPYGALANSTWAGNHALRQTAVSFWKYTLCCVLEAVTMLMAISLCNAIIFSSAGILFKDAGFTGVTLFMGILVENALIVLVMVGSIKGASSITQRALGL